jgi:hypothetical protein
MYNLHKQQDQHNQHNLPPEDNQAEEEDNPNNLQPEDHQAVEEVEEVEVVEEVEEVAEANQQPDNKLQDKPPQLHLAQNP